MRLGKNLLAGLASSIATTAVTLLAVPLYLRYLGIEAYGVIGFFTTLQALLQVLDLGLGPTATREVARFSAAGELPGAARLLHTLAVAYGVVAAVIGLTLGAAAPALAGAWLRTEHLSPGTVAGALALMGLVVSCRWPVALYGAALLGAERMAALSLLGVGAAAVGNLGAAAVLALVSPTLHAFFLWQAAVALVHLAVVRRVAWGVVGRPPGLRFDAGELRRVWRFSAAMSAVAALAVVFTQADKVILSRTLPLGEFGGYVLASTVASALYLLVMPLFNAVYPRFSALVAAGDAPRLAALYRQGTRLLGAGLFPAAMWLFVFGGDLVRVWTGDPALAASVGPVVALLAAGSALHGVMFLPYALQLAHGMARLPLLISAILFVLLVPLLVLLSLRLGAIGGAMAWLLLHALYVTLGTWLTHRVLLPGMGAAWLGKEVGIPLGISLSVGLAGHQALGASGWTSWPRLGCGAALALLATGLTLAASPELRGAVADALRLRRLSSPA